MNIGSEIISNRDAASAQDGSTIVSAFAAPIERIFKNDLVVNRSYFEMLQANGLNRFETFETLSNGELIKRIKSRSVIRFAIADRGRQRFFYLKRHRRQWSGWPFNRGRGFSSIFVSQGRIEFEHCELFRRYGLATVHPVIAGERRRGRFWVDSFVVTEEFAPFVSLEELIRHHQEFFEGEPGKRRKYELLQEIAREARRMHKAGFHHQDFNATHILVHHDEGASKPFAIAFFDLQRVDTSPWSRWRWMTKGLARLNTTLPDPLFTDADRLRLFLFYKRRDCLDPWSRFQWLLLKRKTERIRRHTRKIDVLKRRERARWGIPEP